MTITTSVGYPTEMPEVVAALPRLQEKAGALISHRFPFDRVLDAFGVAGLPCGIDQNFPARLSQSKS